MIIPQVRYGRPKFIYYFGFSELCNNISQWYDRTLLRVARNGKDKRLPVWYCNTGLILQAAAVAVTSPHLCHHGKKKSFGEKNCCCGKKKAYRSKINSSSCIGSIMRCDFLRSLMAFVKSMLRPTSKLRPSASREPSQPAKTRKHEYIQTDM